MPSGSATATVARRIALRGLAFFQKQDKCKNNKTVFKITPRGEDRNPYFSFNLLPVPLRYSLFKPLFCPDNPSHRFG